jgi:isopropylmalate/homocitrate/citramalate synthase
VSTAFGCPFEGAVDPGAVARVSAALIEMGAYEVAVSDTIGIAHPGQIPRVLDAVAARVPLDRIALHFHDTRGTALANVLTALHLGIATFDASAGGLGGCPYAPGATGNLATEDLLYMLDGLGIETGVSLDAVLAASRALEPKLGHPLASRYAAAVSAGKSSA